MKPFLIIGFLVASFATSSLLAQEAAPGTVPRPSGNLRWTIQYHYGGGKKEKKQESSSAASGLRPRISEYELTGAIARHQLTLENGQRDTIYIADHYKLVFDRALGKVLIKDLTRVDPEVPEQLFHQEYPGFEWVRREHFEGERKIGEQPCFYFRYRDLTPAAPEPAGQDEGNDNLSDAPTRSLSRSLRVWEAWVGVETGLPVAFRQGATSGIYTFASPPTRPVSLPPDHLAALKVKTTKGRPPGQAASLAR